MLNGENEIFIFLQHLFLIENQINFSDKGKKGAITKMDFN